jgi:hypothetical protein
MKPIERSKDALCNLKRQTAAIDRAALKYSEIRLKTTKKITWLNSTFQIQ